ncbi:MAG: hypothetical protein QGG38_05380 [Nitrospinaceae bacterium]|nr:hypothetical protein [Nitrospinaceae bacterium]
MEENPTSKNMSSPEETSEPGRKFKASELTFNLPEELQQEFEQQVERLKEQKVTSNMVCKIVRGGSFVTNFHHIAHWQRLSFLTNYCTSFLGFRTVCEEE